MDAAQLACDVPARLTCPEKIYTGNTGEAVAFPDPQESGGKATVPPS